MIRHRGGTLLVAFMLMLPAAGAEAELLSIIHAMPDGPGEWTTNSPVDIKVDGVCEFTRKFYGDKLGPFEVKAGRYKIDVSVYKVGAPCKGKKLATGKVKIKKGGEVDAVIYLANPSGGGKVGKIRTFDNTKSLDPVLSEDWDAAIEVRSVYQSGTVSAVVERAGTEIGSGDVAPGRVLGPFETTAESHEMTVTQGDVTIDTKRGRTRNVRAYWAYVVGAVEEESRELLIFESIPLEPPPRGGGGDGGKEPENQNACCIPGGGNVCSPLSFSNCSTAGGTYVGERGCNPNPCG